MATLEQPLRAELWTPHPVLKLPTREQALALGRDELERVLLEREKLIALERDDAFRYGFYLSCWNDADTLMEECLLTAIFGGNGAGKSYYLARKGVEMMLKKAGSKVLWLHESEKPALDVQHAPVWHYLPSEFREPTTRRSRVRNVTYTVKNGFSDCRFVLPNGSIGMFGTYNQDVAQYEGTGWSLICADENMPLSWLKTLLYRLPRCQGKFLWGYTPLHGITPAIRHITEGAVTERTMPAPLLPPDRRNVPDCPPGTMPYIQRSVWDAVKIIYFPSDANPYAHVEEHTKLVVRGGTAEIEKRFYGYARNTLKAAFPKFGAVHIVAPEKVPRERVTRRLYADPAGARNMFMIWVATDEFERRFVYRDWPDLEHFGEWAVAAEDANKWDGAPGPAQPTLGYGIIDYKRIILEAEGNKLGTDGTWEMCGEEIFERRMDPRSGAAQSMNEREGGTSIMDLMLEEQHSVASEQSGSGRTDGKPIGPSLDFAAALGISIEQGLICINDLLAYNQEEEVCPILNEPKLYISSACQNLVWALQNYTGHDGEKAACKDPIDCLRYMATDDCEYIDPAAMRTAGGGSY